MNIKAVNIRLQQRNIKETSVLSAYAQHFNRLYLRLTEPFPNVTSESDRHASRLFAALMFVLALTTLLTQILPYLPTGEADGVFVAYFVSVVSMFVVMIIAYRMGRQGQYRAPALGISLLFIVVILIIAYPDAGLWELNLLAYTLLPLIIASMFLPISYCWGLFALFVGGLVVLDWLVPEITLLDLLLNVGTFVLIHFVLILVAAGYFRRIEASRVKQQVETEVLRVALAQEHDMNVLKDHIMSTISHEFRNPLAAILSATEMLQAYEDRMTAERRAELYERIYGQVHHLTNMVSDVMLIRRMQSGSLPIERTLIDVDEFITGIVREFETFTAPDHVYTIQCDSDVHEEYVDTRLLRYILVNLVSNAAKYSETGSPISIYVQHGQEWLEIAVSDRGVGISDEDRAHIFEPFFRGKNTNLASGTGLGLKIVKDCVDLHNGKIDFTSGATGTTFTLSLPLPIPAPQANKIHEFFR